VTRARVGSPSGGIVQGVGLLAAVGLAVYAVVAQWSDLRAALDRIGVVAPLLAVLPAVGGLVAGGLAWRVLLADVGSALPLRTSARVFFLGQLAKYLPGGVWPVLAQMQLGKDAGASRRRVGAVAVLVMVVNVVTGLVVAVACLPFTSSDALRQAGWVLAFLPVGIALLHPRVLSVVIGRALRLLRRDPLERTPSYRGVLLASAWSVVMWACFGAHTYLLSHKLAESGHRLPLLATGAFALAWTVGFLVVIAPAGAGIRDGMLVLTLAPAMPTAAATAVTLLSRAAMTVADLLCAAVVAVPPAADPAAPTPPPTGSDSSRRRLL
jgi:uncharacterized membrane protein YbhN (UPF0104 family)